MNRNFFSFIMFISGAGLGSALTWYYVKEKYEKLAQEEIDSVKESLKQKIIEADEKQTESEDMIKKAEEISNEKLASMYDYTKYSENEKADEEVESMVTRPYAITPEESGEREDFEEVSLTFYKGDSILANTFTDEIIEDIDDTVGKDFEKHFGEYEDDSIFIRNENYNVDFEILLDSRSYKDVVDIKNHKY